MRYRILQGVQVVTLTLLILVLTHAPVLAQRCASGEGNVRIADSTRFLRNPIRAGETAQLRVIIRNSRRAIGMAPSFQVSVRSTDGADGPFTQTVPAGMRPGDVRALTFSFVPRGTGMRTYEISIPRTRCLGVQPPNPRTVSLTVQGTSPPPPPPPRGGRAVIALDTVEAIPTARTPGSPAPPALIRATVRNRGDAVATFDLVLEPETRGERISGTTRQTVNNLRGGETRTVDFRFRPACSGDRCCYRVRIERLPAGATVSGPDRKQTCLPGVSATPAPPPPAPPPQNLEITVEVTSVRVIDDGDNLSKGDWAMWLSVGHAPPNSDRFNMQTVPWGGGGDIPVRNIDTGTTINDPNLRLTTTVPTDQSLRIAIEVIDCDASGLVFSRIVSPRVSANGADCSGEEEFWEQSGGNDYAIGMVTLSPQEWMEALRTGRQIEIYFREEGASDPLEGRAYIVIRR